jgi:hypothetical protein
MDSRSSSFGILRSGTAPSMSRRPEGAASPKMAVPSTDDYFNPPSNYGQDGAGAGGGGFSTEFHPHQPRAATSHGTEGSSSSSSSSSFGQGFDFPLNQGGVMSANSFDDDDASQGMMVESLEANPSHALSANPTHCCPKSVLLPP